MRIKLSRTLFSGFSFLVLMLTASLILSACQVKLAETAPKDPTVKPEFSETNSSPEPFPRTFSASFKLLNADTHQFISASGYFGKYQDTDFGCVESPDGRDFTFVMKDTGEYPSDLQIRIKNIFVRESKVKYRDMTEVTFNGFSREKFFEFDSSRTGYQVFKCHADIERVKNFAKGFLQCQYVNSTKRISSSLPRQVHAELTFQCDIVRR